MLLFGCNNLNHSEDSVQLISEFALIPHVYQIEDSPGTINIGSTIEIGWKTNPNETLKNQISNQWHEIQSNQSQDQSTKLEIIIDLDLDLPHQEAYRLEVHQEEIIIRALSQEGVYRAWQTLRQILYLSRGENIGCGTILDFPKYDYRGAMLDVARHFFFG